VVHVVVTGLWRVNCVGFWYGSFNAMSVGILSAIDKVKPFGYVPSYSFLLSQSIPLRFRQFIAVT